MHKANGGSSFLHALPSTARLSQKGSFLGSKAWDSRSCLIDSTDRGREVRGSLSMPVHKHAKTMQYLGGNQLWDPPRSLPLGARECK